MRINEFIDNLEKIGITRGISQKTIKRWAYQGLISPPSPAKRGGRGQAAHWHEKSLLQAAGVWAMQQASTTRLTVPELLHLRIMGDEIHKNGRCKLKYPNLNKYIEKSSPLQSLRLRQDTAEVQIPLEKVTIEFDVFDDDPRHHDLYSTYVCAKEKAKHSPRDAEIWPITKPTWAYLYYVEMQGTMVFRPDEAPEPFTMIELSQSRLEEAKDRKNKVFFFFDGRDARAVPEYIAVHVGEK